MTCQEETGNSQMTSKVCPASQPFRLSFCASSKPSFAFLPVPHFFPKADGLIDVGSLFLEKKPQLPLLKKQMGDWKVGASIE